VWFAFAFNLWELVSFFFEEMGAC